MCKDNKSNEIIKLDADIMDCFNSNEELAVITGGKVWDKIMELIDEINIGNCGCTNNCKC